MARQTMQRLTSLIEESESGCLLYTGKLEQHNGYGRIMVDYHVYPVHRLFYLLFVGPIPDGYQIDHLCHDDDCPGGLCDHRRCVNPDHLKAVTPAENTLRTNAVSGVNSRKTHCPREHPYSHVNKDGKRCCRICQREQGRKSDKKRRSRVRP